MPSDQIPGAAPSRAGSTDHVATDESVVAFVADALSDTTPRAAALALLRFGEYLALLRRIGVDVCPNGALASALRTGMARVCREDGAASPADSRSPAIDGG
jgi:hypothetical protein